MKEINMSVTLFRGKTPTECEKGVFGEWVTGFYTCFNGKEHRIYSGYAETDCGDYYPDWCNVIPETVGRYTGLHDCGKNMLFEHDVVTAKFKSNGARFNFKIIFKNGAFLFDNGHIASRFDQIRSVVKIGNIHDNPELLRR